jgi:hypothetical protein
MTKPSKRLFFKIIRPFNFQQATPVNGVWTIGAPKISKTNFLRVPGICLPQKHFCTSKRSNPHYMPPSEVFFPPQNAQIHSLLLLRCQVWTAGGTYDIWWQNVTPLVWWWWAGGMSLCWCRNKTGDLFWSSAETCKKKSLFFMIFRNLRKFHGMLALATSKI